MSANSNLHKAKKAKNDEFYTQISDIEKELQHYPDQFEDKVVYCNADDPDFSQFWVFFKMNFKDLGLKKLIATYYDAVNPVYKWEYDGSKTTKTLLRSNGDFRSDECVEILKTADRVVTNPPFSLFREYVALMMRWSNDEL